MSGMQNIKTSLRFHGTAVSKVQFTSAQGQLYRTSNRFENHRTQRTQIFTVTTAPFRSKLESNGLQIDHNRKFSERIFSTPAIFKATSKFFGLRGWAALTTKTDLNYPAISVGFVDFAVQFCFHCKFSFHEKRCSSQV